MAFTDNERIQEFFILIGDKLAPVKKIWWYGLLVCLISAIPGYFVIRFLFIEAMVGSYTGPAIIYTLQAKEPLQVIDKKIFTLSTSPTGGPDQTYSGYFKIRNIELEWGVPNQTYTVQFKTFGGTIINQASRTTFILPASEKLVILPRFTSPTKPDELVISLADSHFVHKPELSLNFDIERTSLQNNQDGLIVSSAFKNLSPFILKQVDLPVAVFNSRNEIIAVNFTYVNDVSASETRSFQYSWPSGIAEAIRAEINPEINVFDRKIITTEAGISPF
ncbi:MAG: hypothetical protein A3B10_04435 [Candidatus Doudnabacteria bacterium RIFCSPLOWO2_01_FULL_44_21]|uniref:Uncharacterized protein n=1 Tax=Candidatus Doudnabacteria bacterium RIFCSPLOWO2_01_FULL_44_21 TaxID=1817841 RepID=A0A1F5PXR5_9BACT|nr:MAG: hypothetical protein A3B95_01400 [Candidatus Doudnabacteria bacterium RIFCSPHIGHO2_02_FULL_43_13b]OGE94728.1 MAG: hypothetical protein A3B10_04435 [Candidatus Doudnabacteria bacterium RIFCSPLOWO2_01_FULL_44_21]